MRSLVLSSILFFMAFSYAHGQVVHRLETGETLYRIARQFGVSVKALMDANGISDPTAIKVGTVLNIPGKSGQSSASASTPRATSVAKSHKVVAGDTYYNIARRYKVSVNQLLAVNNRNANVLLRVSETLRIPGAQGAAHSENVAVASYTSGSVAQSPMRTSGNVTWPVSGRMSKHTGKQGGVKIQLSGTQDVRAVASGTVVYHGRYRELGPIVLVEHDGGYIYIYGGVSSSMMKVGDRVAVGDVLGRSTAGRDVVFSVFKDANPIDPNSAPRV